MNYILYPRDAKSVVKTHSLRCAGRNFYPSSKLDKHPDARVSVCVVCTCAEDMILARNEYVCTIHRYR